MSGARIRWVRGGESEIVSISAGVIVLRSPVPAPPGSRLEGTVETAGPELAVTVRIKVHASKRVGEAEFLLQGRPLDLTREVRRYLEALAVSSTSSHGTA